MSLSDATDGLAGPYGPAVNGSDVLAVRFEGSGSGDGDGAIINCAGAAVGTAGVGWSIFHIAKDSSGEPELRCKYRGAKNWKSDALVRGIEGLQLLYGVQAQDAGMPLRYVNASALRAQAGGWQSVKAVKIALLARGKYPAAAGALAHDLFGAGYDSSHDPGTRIDASRLPVASRRLLRRVYSATVYLRNGAPEKP